MFLSTPEDLNYPRMCKYSFNTDTEVDVNLFIKLQPFESLIITQQSSDTNENMVQMYDHTSKDHILYKVYPGRLSFALFSLMSASSEQQRESITLKVI